MARRIVLETIAEELAIPSDDLRRWLDTNGFPAAAQQKTVSATEASAIKASYRALNRDRPGGQVADGGLAAIAPRPNPDAGHAGGADLLFAAIAERWKSESKGLKGMMENHPFVIIMAIVFSVSSAMFAIINGWMTRAHDLKQLELSNKYENETVQMKLDYQRKLTELESERSRIKVTVGEASRFISSNDVFIPASQMPPGYSVLEGGIFAVPIVHLKEDRWSWRTRNEWDLLAEFAGNEHLGKLLPDRQREAIENEGKMTPVVCFESDRIYEVAEGDFRFKLRPRIFFQRMTWNELSRYATSLNAANVDSLFDYVRNIGKDIDLFDITELALVTRRNRETQEQFLKGLRPGVEDRLAETAMDHPGRAALFLAYVETQISADLARSLKESSDKRQAGLAVEKEREKKEDSDRRKNRVKVEPSRLSSFLRLFSSTAGDTEGLGRFVATDYSFNNNAFSLQGYFDLTIDRGIKPGPVTRLYVLRLGFMRDDGIYLMGFVYPATKEYSELREMMSLISGARIIN